MRGWLLMTHPASSTLTKPPRYGPTPGGGDSRLRAAVSADLEFAAESPFEGERLIVNEFVIGEVGRIDIAVIDAGMHGYELKSARDTLTRLPRQMDIYGKVFDYCTLVVAPCHLAGARAVLRRGWGLSVLEEDSTGSARLRKVRTAKANRGVRADVLVQLLWRNEALAALESVGADLGLRSKPRTDMWNRLCEVTDLVELKRIVRTTLRERQGWRDGVPRRANDARYQPGAMSSDFLARRVR